MEAILQETIRQTLPETFWEYLKGAKFRIDPGVLTIIIPDRHCAIALTVPSLWPDAMDSVGCDRLIITDQAGYVQEMTLELCVEWQHTTFLEWESLLRWILFVSTLPESLQERLEEQGVWVYPKGDRLDLYAVPEHVPDVLPLLYWLGGVDRFGFQQVRMMESYCKPRLNLSIDEIRRLLRHGFDRLVDA